MDAMNSLEKAYKMRESYNTFGNSIPLESCKQQVLKGLPKEKMKEWKEQLKALRALNLSDEWGASGEIGLRVSLPFPDFFTKDEWEELYKIFGGAENAKYFPRFDSANSDINTVHAFEYRVMIILKVLFNEILEEEKNK